MLEIRLLGQFEIRRDGQLVRLPLRPAQALLAYLLLNPTLPHRREKLAGLFWPDVPEASARSSLRHALWLLRKVLGTSPTTGRDYLLADDFTVALDSESDLWLDTRVLEQPEQAPSIGILASAVEVYRGELLPGFYEDWVCVERERLQAAFESRMTLLLEQLLRAERWDEALAWGERWIAFGRVPEAAYRALITAHGQRGDASRAAAAYRRCVDALQRELGVEPSAQTRAAYERALKTPAGAADLSATATELPGGAVTFVYAGLHSAEPLAPSVGTAPAVVWAERQRLLRASFEKWHGREIDTPADALLAAFSRAADAVGAVVEAQRALAAQSGPDGDSACVRMALHTGEAVSNGAGDGSLAGQRAARLAQAGHGGQVLLSETTTALVSDDLPAGVQLVDLGRHLLPELHRPEHIFQIAIAGLPAQFPALASLGVLPAKEARPPRQVGPSPYRGLFAFQESDAAFFFGREDFVCALEGAVRAQPRVAVIVGSSGSGKSSALLAGLLPRLRAEPGWEIGLMRPGSQPFYALASVLLPRLEPGLNEIDQLGETRSLADRLRAGEIALDQVVQRLLQKGPSARRFLLVIDQFEELYTLAGDEAEQVSFIEALLGAVAAFSEQRAAPFGLVLTLRADFMGEALSHRRFADLLQGASLLLGPMSPAELRLAVEKPAARQGAAFEAGLVERILDDVGARPGHLPLLQFALTLLWEQHEAGWLTHAAYEAIGGVDGALARYADEVFAELPADEQEQARRLFVQLVLPGEGTAHTRRVAKRAELGERGWRLTRHLADKRLVVTDRDAGSGEEIVEVAHEALIQRWGKLQAWMQEDRVFRSWQERLRAALHQWQTSGRDEGALLRGGPLVTAEEWLHERGAELGTFEQDFIRQSVAAREGELQQRQRRRRLTFVGLAGGLVIALALAAAALILRQNSLRQAAILLAQQAENEVQSGNPDRAVLLALEALEHYPYTPQAEHALGQAVTLGRAVRLLPGHTNTVDGVAWSPDGRFIATASLDRTVRVWDAATGQAVSRLEAEDQVYTVVWSPSGDTLLYTTGDRMPYQTGDQGIDVFLWDLRASVPITIYTAPVYGVGTTQGVSEKLIQAINANHTAAFSPDGERLAFISDRTVTVWDLAQGEAEFELAGHTDLVYSVAWSPDGRRLLSGGEDGTARLWEAADGRALATLEGHTESVTAALWSPDGAQVATASRDGTVVVWRVSDGTQAMRLEVDPEAVWDLAWSPDGSRLATANASGLVQVWDAEHWEVDFTLRGHARWATSVAWSPDGRQVVSGAHDTTVYVWKATPGVEHFTLDDPSGTISAVGWSPDGRQLLTAGGTWLEIGVMDGYVELWDMASGQLATRYEPALDAVFQVDWSPDGRHFLTRQGPSLHPTDDTVLVWDAVQAEVITVIPVVALPEFVRDAAWSPDGQRIAAVTNNGLADVYDPFTGAKITTYTGHAAGVFLVDVTWSPDGQWVASSGYGEVRIWDSQTGEERMRLDGFDDAVNGLKWSPAGDRICAASGPIEMGGSDPTIRIFDANTGQQQLLITGHTSGLWECGWSPNGRRVFSSSLDGTTRVWDAATGAELLRLHAPTPWALFAAWSPSGEYLATSGDSQPARVWRVWQSTQELIDYARECCVIRDLTAEERERFGLPAAAP